MRYISYFNAYIKLKLVLLLLLFVFRLNAVNRDFGLTNSVAIHLGGGYPFVFDDFAETTNLGRYSASLGVSYMFKMYNGFWFDAGLEYQEQVAMSTYNMSGTDVLVYDTQGKEMMFHYKFNSTYDYQYFNVINLPIVVGYFYKGFYIGAGPKIGMCVNILETSEVNYTTSSSYNQYIEDFEGMPNHYNATYTTKCKERLLPSLKLSAVFEMGYDFLVKLNSNNYHTLKFSLFGEVSMFDLKSNSNNLLLYRIDQENASYLQLAPFYYTKSTNGNRVVSLYSAIVGLKLSWIINFPPKNCKNCNNWNRSRLLK
jgi:hypothetical protein